MPKGDRKIIVWKASALLTRYCFGTQAPRCSGTSTRASTSTCSMRRTTSTRSASAPTATGSAPPPTRASRSGYEFARAVRLGSRHVLLCVFSCRTSSPSLWSMSSSPRFSRADRRSRRPPAFPSRGAPTATLSSPATPTTSSACGRCPTCREWLQSWLLHAFPPPTSFHFHPLIFSDFGARSCESSRSG